MNIEYKRNVLAVCDSGGKVGKMKNRPSLLANVRILENTSCHVLSAVVLAFSTYYEGLPRH